MNNKENISKFITSVFPYKPEQAEIVQDNRGWSDTKNLIQEIRANQGHSIVDVEGRRMRYTATIKLPVENSNHHFHTLSHNVVENILNILDEESKIIAIEWKNGDCVVTVEVLCQELLESSYDSMELFVRDVYSKTYRKKT